jgi:hypothetical protein
MRHVDKGVVHMAVTYYFRCPVCGEYPVTTETFIKFTTGEIWQSVEDALNQGAHCAVVEFDEKCPRCVIEQKWHLKSTIKILWPKGMRRGNL